MRKRPVKFSCLRVQRTEGEWAIVDSSHGDNLRVISRREYFIRCLKALVGQSLLNHRHAVIAQQADDSLTSNAGQKSSIRDGCVNHAILGHENVRGSQLGDVAQHVANDRVVETAGLHLEKGEGVGGVKTS